jgi:hypothetical protein
MSAISTGSRLESNSQPSPATAAKDGMQGNRRRAGIGDPANDAVHLPVSLVPAGMEGQGHSLAIIGAPSSGPVCPVGKMIGGDGGANSLAVAGRQTMSSVEPITEANLAVTQPVAASAQIVRRGDSDPHHIGTLVLQANIGGRMNLIGFPSPPGSKDPGKIIITTDRERVDPGQFKAWANSFGPHPVWTPGPGVQRVIPHTMSPSDMKIRLVQEEAGEVTPYVNIQTGEGEEIDGTLLDMTDRMKGGSAILLQFPLLDRFEGLKRRRNGHALLLHDAKNPYDVHFMYQHHPDVSSVAATSHTIMQFAYACKKLIMEKGGLDAWRLYNAWKMLAKSKVYEDTPQPQRALFYLALVMEESYGISGRRSVSGKLLEGLGSSIASLAGSVSPSVVRRALDMADYTAKDIPLGRLDPIVPRVGQQQDTVQLLEDSRRQLEILERGFEALIDRDAVSPGNTIVLNGIFDIAERSNHYVVLEQAAEVLHRLYLQFEAMDMLYHTNTEIKRTGIYFSDGTGDKIAGAAAMVYVKMLEFLREQSVDMNHLHNFICRIHWDWFKQGVGDECSKAGPVICAMKKTGHRYAVNANDGDEKIMSQIVRFIQKYAEDLQYWDIDQDDSGQRMNEISVQDLLGVHLPHPDQRL